MSGNKRNNKNKKRRVRNVVLCIIAAMFLAAAGLIALSYGKQLTLPPAGESDVIIVLGAQVKPNGVPSVALERRLTLALETYLETPQKIIVCGARGGDEPATEASVMCAWLLERGVNAADVLQEDKSFNTRENLENAKAMMEAQGLSEALIITSDYHVARALSLCADIGLEATGKGSPSKPEYFIKNYLREGASWVKYMLERILDA